MNLMPSTILWYFRHILKGIKLTKNPNHELTKSFGGKKAELRSFLEPNELPLTSKFSHWLFRFLMQVYDNNLSPFKKLIILFLMIFNKLGLSFCEL